MTVLEPKPTKQDLRVLRAVPSDREHGVTAMATIWQLGEILDTTDLADLERTLNGFEHLGYISSVVIAKRKQRIWWRRGKGDEAVVRDGGR